MNPAESGSGDTLALNQIEKHFGRVHALAAVDFAVDGGEVHALLGENGAGKTTLMNIASGVLRPDGGKILVGGRDTAMRSPRDGFRAGVGMVHQSYRLVSNFSVAENVHLGWEEAPAIGPRRALEMRTAALAERFGIDVEPGALIAQLSVGEQQRVAILRTLARGANVLVLDEPTAALTPGETDRLFATIRRLVEQGRSVVFISHKLREVTEIADRVTVLRQGRRVATMKASDVSVSDLARLMVGRDVGARSRDPATGGAVPSGVPVLQTHGLCAVSERGLKALHGVDVTVMRNEIMGVAGVSGNGQQELAEVLTGLRPPSAGEISLDGEGVTRWTPAGLIRRGVGHVPEDTRMGLAFGERLDKNAVMKSLEEPELTWGPWLALSAIKALAKRLLERAGLGELASDRTVGTLSGGQAQRLLVQRELFTSKRVLVAAHPTRGLDVAGIEVVHGALRSARDRGTAVVLVSEDLDEILTLADRMIVLYEGRVMATLERSEFDRDRIGALMGGVERPSSLAASERSDRKMRDDDVAEPAAGGS